MRILGSLFLAAALLTGSSTVLAQDSAGLEGAWTITIEFIRGKAEHTATFAVKDSALTGKYKGSVKEAALRGTVKGSTVTFSTNLAHQSADAPFRFTGVRTGDTMEGTVDMGEYWTAKWKAKKTGK